jgi:hypothetical protein
MFYKYEKDAEWGSKCPRYNSKIVGSMSNREAGSKSSARCSKSPFNSVITINTREFGLCHLAAEVIGQGNGRAGTKDADGIWLR